MPSGSTTRGCATAALIAVSVALPAFAQGTASDYPPACAESKVSASDRDGAHAFYVTAKRFLDESAYDKAISLLKDAYALNCSVHDFLPVIATAYERKGDRKEALHALEEYLSRVPSGSETSKEDLQAREKIERRIKNLKEAIAAQPPTVSVPPIAPPPPSATAAPTAVPAVVPAAAAVPVVVPHAPPPPPPPHVVPSATGGRSIIPLLVGGLGGAGLAGVGTAFYVLGAGQYSTAEKACPTHKSCPPDVTNSGEEGRTFMRVGVGGMIAGSVVLIGGVVWYFTQSSTAAAHKMGKAQPYVLPIVAPNFGGASAGFTF